jgi:hypothetical protein
MSLSTASNLRRIFALRSGMDRSSEANPFRGMAPAYVRPAWSAHPSASVLVVSGAVSLRSRRLTSRHHRVASNVYPFRQVAFSASWWSTHRRVVPSDRRGKEHLGSGRSPGYDGETPKERTSKRAAVSQLCPTPCLVSRRAIR